MTHSFNTTLAERYGIDEAILIEHIYWWIHKNDCEEIEDMIHEGKVWCRSTAKGFAKYIPYMKPDKIWRKLKKLEGHVLLVGNFNRQALNQTLWYTFTDEFKKELDDLNYDFENFKNANLKNEKSYNSIINNPINIEDNIKENKKTLSKDNSKDDLFEKFWADFGRKGSKTNALKEWNKLKAKQKEIVLNKVSDYILFCKRSNRAKKDASSYLHQEYFNQEWNQIPDYYQPNEHDDKRISKFKRYMCEKFPDLIYHHNPLTFEQLDGLFGEYPVEVVEDAMRELSHRYIHQYYKVLDGINDIIKEKEDEVL